MSTIKHNEFLDHLFTNILRKPMMSEYHPECEQTECHTQHLGRCRRLCYNCNGTKYINIPPRYNTVLTYRVANYTPHVVQGLRFKVSSTSEDLETVRKGLHTWYELDFKCDSCKYAEEWKKENWGKCVEKAIGGGTSHKGEKGVKKNIL